MSVRPDASAINRNISNSSSKSTKSEMPCTTPLPVDPRARAMPTNSSAWAVIDGVTTPLESRCLIVRDVLKPSAPASTASRTTSPMRSISSGSATSWAGPRSPITYARTAPCGTWVPTSTARGRSFECVEVFGERLPLPVDAFVERRAGDVLDPFHQADEPVALVGLARSEPDPAVPRDDGGHPMERRGRQERIPGHLAVVVGVGVDEARCHEQARRVDDFGGVADQRLVEVADGFDPVADDADVGSLRRRADPVVHRPATNHQVVHVGSPCVPS